MQTKPKEGADSSGKSKEFLRIEKELTLMPHRRGRGGRGGRGRGRGKGRGRKR